MVDITLFSTKQHPLNSRHPNYTLQQCKIVVTINMIKSSNIQYSSVSFRKRMTDKILCLRPNLRKQQTLLFSSDETLRLTSAESLHRDPNPYAVGSFQGVGSWEILTLRQLKLHQDEGV